MFLYTILLSSISGESSSATAVGSWQHRLGFIITSHKESNSVFEIPYGCHLCLQKQLLPLKVSSLLYACMPEFEELKLDHEGCVLEKCTNDFHRCQELAIHMGIAKFKNKVLESCDMLAQAISFATL